MSNLIEVKQKIQATKNTKKITRAMQLVAANKMKKFQDKAFATRAYSAKLLESLEQLHANFSQVSYGEQREEGTTLFVLLTSDKGLCGAMNNRLVNQLFKSEEWNSLKSDERELITIGKKSKQAAKRMNVEPLKSFEAIREEMDSYNALTLIEKILVHWEEKKCKKVVLVSPHYVNPFTIHITSKQYLPFNEDMLKSHFDWIREEGEEKKVDPVMFDDEGLEPGEDRMVEVLSDQLLNALFVQSFYELKASEYSSRMVAMKKATEASDDIISDLTLEYNKARQAKITQELSELAAGSAALS